MAMDFTNPAYASLATSYPNYVYWLAKTFSPRYFVVMARYEGSCVGFVKVNVSTS